MHTSQSTCVRHGAVMQRPLALALTLALGAIPLGGVAATISVNTVDDAGVAGTCTVRQAIVSMNTGSVSGSGCANTGAAFGSSDTIHFDTTTFPNGSTITLADVVNNYLSISDANLTIDATANGNVTIQRASSAANAFGIIYVSRATRGTLTLNHLTLSNGKVTANTCNAYPQGAGICIPAANLVLSNSTLSGNSAATGGGIYTYSGSVTLTNSTLSGNSAALGGGIHTYSGSVTLTNSTLSGNSAQYGGGIDSRSGSVTLSNSTLSGNSAYPKDGGGIYTYSSSVTLTNSTLSGNSAYRDGGGINSKSGSVTLTNSTLTANTSKGVGGGIDSVTYAVKAINSIVAGNTQGNGGDITSGVTADSTGNMIGGTPKLGALANNGGPTQTMLPQPGSPAINAIVCTNAPLADQRNYLRPDPSSVGLATPCDIGAVEAGSVLSNRIFADGFGPPPSYK